SRLCPGCLDKLTHHPAPDRLAERGWKWAHCTGCGLSMDRDHAAARRIVSRGLLAQTHTTTHTRTIRTTVDGTVTLVRRPKKTTRRLRRQRQAEQAPPRPHGPKTKTTPGKAHPTPSRPTRPRHQDPPHATRGQVPGHKTSRRMPDVRTVPATTPIGMVQRPAGHDTTTPAAFRPVPGHGVPAHAQAEDLLPPGRGRLSRRTCRRRTRAAERTGFHHLHATPAHPLTPRIGSPDGTRTRPRRARKARKPRAHTEF
ncbi:hypothetical protein ABZY09_49065, partial [Streptomyces sp. NPDC002928]